MKNTIRIQHAVLGLGLVLALLAFPALGAAVGGGWADTPSTDPDLVKADKAIKAREWDKAAELLNSALTRDRKNADIYNMLGFVERNRGNLDEAFKQYGQALTLDRKHKGAHEYIGEAYLMTGNLAKAEEHLAILDKLCFFPCEEYRDLKAAVAAYKQKGGK